LDKQDTGTGNITSVLWSENRVEYLFFIPKLYSRKFFFLLLLQSSPLPFLQRKPY